MIIIVLVLLYCTALSSPVNYEWSLLEKEAAKQLSSLTECKTLLEQLEAKLLLRSHPSKNRFLTIRDMLKDLDENPSGTVKNVAKQLKEL
jgi:hypothetical protein